MFALGIVGTAVIANLSRVMLVIRRLKVAAAALAGSWLVAIVADVVLVQLVPARLVTPRRWPWASPSARLSWPSRW